MTVKKSDDEIIETDEINDDESEISK